MLHKQNSKIQSTHGLRLKALYILLFILRIAMGWLMLEAGLTKILSGNFTAASFLNRAVGPFAGLFQNLAASTDILTVINSLVMWGEFLIGVALILGILVRFASFWGAIMMLVYYLPSLPPATGWITQQIIYMLAFIIFMFTGVGYFLGIDRFARKFEEERHWLRFFLG